MPDTANRRVFITRKTGVMVAGENIGKLRDEIMGINGTHCAAPVNATGHGFATSGTGGVVLMFDLKTFKVLDKIHAAEDADAIIYDGPSKHCLARYMAWLVQRDGDRAGSAGKLNDRRGYRKTPGLVVWLRIYVRRPNPNSK